MTRTGVEYTVGSALLALLVVGGGLLMGGTDVARGVIWGASVAWVVQVAVFWGLFVWALPSQRGLAHGLGAMIRFAAVAAMAFLGLAAWDLAPLPTLFSMVACLFGATLLEPLFLSRHDRAGAPATPATMRTQS